MITRENVHEVMRLAKRDYARAQLAHGQRYAAAQQPGANFPHRALINARSAQCDRLMAGTTAKHKMGALPKAGVQVTVNGHEGRVVWIPKERAYALSTIPWLTWTRGTVKSLEWVNNRPVLTVKERD